MSEFDACHQRLRQQAAEIQRHHEVLQDDLNAVLSSLTQNFIKWNIPLPKGLANKDKHISVMKTQENMSTLLQRCTSSDKHVQLLATKECRKLLSDQQPPIKELVDMGLVPVFINFLANDGNPKLQFEAAWVLTNICSGNSQQTRAVVDCGAIPVLIRLLGAAPELAEQCVWALGNIAADSASCRDVLLKRNVIAGLRPLMSSTRITMLKNVSWTMSNLCNGVPDHHWPKVRLALPDFSRLVFCADEEILKDVCWTLSYISSGTKERIQAIVELDTSICRRLVELLRHSSPSVQHAALITVGNIVTGSDDQTQILLNQHLLQRLQLLLSHSKKTILKDACFTISNIAAGNKAQIQALIDARIIPALVLLFRTSSQFEIKIEATWALSNALSNGKDEHIRYLVGQGCIVPLSALLADYDTITLEAVLEGFEHILRVGEIDLYANGDGINYFLKAFLEAQCPQKLRAIRDTVEPSLLPKIDRILATLHRSEQSQLQKKK
jgi:importin subunit alpha-6/7